MTTSPISPSSPLPPPPPTQTTTIFNYIETEKEETEEQFTDPIITTHTMVHLHPKKIVPANNTNPLSFSPTENNINNNTPSDEQIQLSPLPQHSHRHATTTSQQLFSSSAQHARVASHGGDYELKTPTPSHTAHNNNDNNSHNGPTSSIFNAVEDDHTITQNEPNNSNNSNSTLSNNVNHENDQNNNKETTTNTTTATTTTKSNETIQKIKNWLTNNIFTLYFNQFKQQQLYAWQPVMNPIYVISFFYVIGVIMVGIGVALLFAHKSVIQHEWIYASPKSNNDIDEKNVCVMVRNESLGGAMFCEETISVLIDRDMHPPIYMLYGLKNFYQNARQFASSYSDSQLMGRVNLTYSDLKDDCKGMVYDDDAIDIKKNTTTTSRKRMILDPCGWVAYSMFNDTYVMYKNEANADVSENATTIVCDTKNEIGCTKRGIAWSSDKRKKYVRPDKPSHYLMYNQTYANESTHVIPDVEDEDFMVWMKPATLGTFRKLYRVIHETIPKGEYKLHIRQNFPVAEFDGTKFLVLSTMSWAGGENRFMSISYIVMGGLWVGLATLFLVVTMIHLARSRLAQKGDHHHHGSTNIQEE